MPEESYFTEKAYTNKMIYASFVLITVIISVKKRSSLHAFRGETSSGARVTKVSLQ
jgi:hypothetical protein